jgi:hypothetical protein
LLSTIYKHLITCNKIICLLAKKIELLLTQIIYTYLKNVQHNNPRFNNNSNVKRHSSNGSCRKPAGHPGGSLGCAEFCSLPRNNDRKEGFDMTASAKIYSSCPTGISLVFFTAFWRSVISLIAELATFRKPTRVYKDILQLMKDCRASELLQVLLDKDYQWQLVRFVLNTVTI